MKDFIEKKLSNGIKVYYYSDKSLKRVYASINIFYGTNGYYDNFIYNNKEYHVKPAMAHFLEHYLIETSKNGNMLLKYYDKSYEANGITYPDLTSYYFVGIDSKSNIYTSILELLVMIEEPVFSNKNVDKIKSAICRELTKSKDSRYQIARSNNRHNLHSAYDAVPVDNNVLGSVSTTEAITLDEVKTCYNAYYNNQNKFIVIAGNIDINKIHSILESYYKKIRPHNNLLIDYNYVGKDKARKKVEIINMPTDADIVYSSFKFPVDESLSLLEQNYYFHTYMSTTLASSKKDIEKLIRNKNIIGGIYYDYDYFKGSCDILISFESYKSRETIKLVESILNAKKFSKTEFELFRKNAIASEISKQNYIYNQFKYFPTKVEFSTHIDEIKSLKTFRFNKYKDFISKIDFKFETTTIVTEKKN